MLLNKSYHDTKIFLKLCFCSVVDQQPSNSSSQCLQDIFTSGLQVGPYLLLQLWIFHYSSLTHGGATLKQKSVLCKCVVVNVHVSHIVSMLFLHNIVRLRVQDYTDVYPLNGFSECLGTNSWHQEKQPVLLQEDKKKPYCSLTSLYLELCNY